MISQHPARGINRQGLDAAFEADEARKSSLLLEAQLLRERGQDEAAARKFAEAAVIEEQLSDICSARGLLEKSFAHRFSAASSWSQAGNLYQAIAFCDELLSDANLPERFRQRIKNYAQTLRTRRAHSQPLESPSVSVTKGRRHQELISDVSQILIQTEDLLGEAVPEVARLLAGKLHAECVCIFFRRRINKELLRAGLAVNEAGVATRHDEDDRFAWDRTYDRNSRTLLYKAYKGRAPFNLGPAELAGEEVDQEIVNRFRSCLPSGRFEHVIIVGLHIGDKQLGAIRVINHLDPRNHFAISNKYFSDEQDVAVVSSIGAMLALAYANHRKGEKMIALGKLADVIGQVATEAEAVQVCLQNLASEKTGFPLAMWRKYESDGSSRVVQYHSPDEIALDPPGLPLDSGQGLQLARLPKVVAINEENFHFHNWARKNNLGAVYAHEMLCSGQKHALVVFADDTGEFDPLSQILIGINTDLLESTFGRIQSESATTGIVGSSERIKQCIDNARKLARGHSTVLIYGETGTGKELFARLIHSSSERRNAPFVVVNCAALPETLLESALFGHKKSAFTGADSDYKGCFEQADNGTIFLDEIGDMSPATQAKLLRVLENMEIQPLKSETCIKVNVRVVAATHQNLEKLVDEGKFRNDLYGRLEGHVITLPSLRERPDDIPVLANHFLVGTTNLNGTKVRRIDGNAMRALTRHDWPRNVRQLKKTVETAAELASGDTIILKDLPEKIRSAIDARSESAHSVTKQEFEKRFYPAFTDSETIEEAAGKLGVSVIEAERIAEQLALKPGVRVPCKQALRAYAEKVKNAVQSNAETARVLGVSEKTIFNWFHDDRSHS